MKQRALGTKILLAVITLGVVAYFGIQALRYFADPLATTAAYTYQVDRSVSLSGYVVREELVLEDSDGLLRLQRTEGERVSAGGTVAVVYADQASLDRQTELDTLEARLEQLEFAQEAAEGAEVALKLDNQIIQSILDLRGSLAADRLDKAESYGDTLRSLVLKRDYTYSETEDLSAQITELKSQISTLRTQAASSTRRITAPEAGLYSAVVDGYEQVLTPEVLETLTPSTLTAIQADESLQTDVGKLILGDNWYYAAVVSQADAETLSEGRSMHLRFSKGVEQDLSVTVSHISEAENGRVVVVLKGNTYLPELTLLRQQSAEVILGSLEGIRVPREALRAEETSVDENGELVTTEQTGVYCLVGMEARFKPVEVLYSGDGFALVRSAYDTAAGDLTSSQEVARLRDGDQVIVTGRDLYDGKVLN
ncbi:HlyD family efflux transporter periplasmic adaptor subunit [Dysosmobacter sp.]|uniref:HlyD family efflux transporter periplasmic adaptor subunit n=1 Tax=Dysosmobacter sp. TaxID=2591382 RepID=UPI003A8DD5A0